MSASEKPRIVTLNLVPGEAPESWESWVVALAGYPAPEPQAAATRGWLLRLADESLKTGGLTATIALQINELHLGGGAEMVQQHGLAWMPQMGLGVFPDQDPPRPWTAFDFEAIELKEGATVRPLMHQVLALGGAPEDILSARAQMPGRGCYVELHARRSGDELLEAFTAASQDKITDAMFSGFPFLFPLLNGQSFATLTSDELGRRLAGAEFYARDSASDGGLLLACKGGFADLFAALGGERQKNGAWKFEWPVS